MMDLRDLILIMTIAEAETLLMALDGKRANLSGSDAVLIGKLSHLITQARKERGGKYDKKNARRIYSEVDRNKSENS
jgi:hypothetical protein